ncbi:MAG: alpha-glucan family phosphorylase, partial [bacterium]|nr:alpha-glucan family phosphorylase [bacterium]
MRPIKTYNVIPTIPDRLKRLEDLAYNLWWCWDPEAIILWRRLSNSLWEASNHNPVKMLGMASQERLEKRATDEGFLSQMDRIGARLDEYMKAKTWYDWKFGKTTKKRVCYFSAEYGITECLPIYSGGLGILAGDHLKSSSDMGIPMAAIGLLYQVGFFSQMLTADGWQEESYPTNDFYNMPVQQLKEDDDSPLTISIDFPGRVVLAYIWKAQVGRVPLYLLDTNVEENDSEDRQITGRLYGGDIEMRIKQEIILGVGGMNTLRKLGIHSTVYHMNEGHSAFLSLERIKTHMERHDMDFRSALEATKAGNLFTTHTPVPAGIDIFSRELMEKYFAEYDEAFGISWEEFLSMGRQNQSDPNGGFSMAVLAIRLSSATNGVSKLHGAVSRNMWRDLWPVIPLDEVPIGSVTNGVHHRSWLSYEMSTLFDRYLGPRWVTHPGDQSIWERIDDIPGAELWRTHERRRERLVAFSRNTLQKQLKVRGALPSEVEEAKTVLDPEALTIGFARRFATYKRATLILQDPDRLERILCDPDRPVQIIFAGKAHPKDMPGKELIRQVIQLAREERFKRHIIFLDDYNTTIARYMVQGVDVWLNTPRRLQEASGTSGMKSSANGVLNVSILDGWWDESYSLDIGWAIDPSRQSFDSQEYQDQVESQTLHDILEHEVVPLF